MADISKCTNEKCPLRKKCYRYTAIASKFWQSYMEFNFVTKDGKTTCDDFWTIKKEKSNE